METYNQTWKCQKCKEQRGIQDWRVDEFGRKKSNIICNHCVEANKRELYGGINDNTTTKRIVFRYRQNGIKTEKSFGYTKCDREVAMQKAKAYQKHMSDLKNGIVPDQPLPVAKELHGCIHNDVYAEVVLFRCYVNGVRKDKEWRYKRCGLEAAMAKAKAYQLEISQMKNSSV